MILQWSNVIKLWLMDIVWTKMTDTIATVVTKNFQSKQN